MSCCVTVTVSECQRYDVYSALDSVVDAMRISVLPDCKNEDPGFIYLPILRTTYLLTFNLLSPTCLLLAWARGLGTSRYIHRWR